MDKAKGLQVIQLLEPGVGHILTLRVPLVIIHFRYPIAYNSINSNFVSEFKFYFFRAINILSQVLVICPLNLGLMSYENICLFVK